MGNPEDDLTNREEKIGRLIQALYVKEYAIIRELIDDTQSLNGNTTLGGDDVVDDSSALPKIDPIVPADTSFSTAAFMQKKASPGDKGP